MWQRCGSESLGHWASNSYCSGGGAQERDRGERYTLKMPHITFVVCLPRPGGAHEGGGDALWWGKMKMPHITFDLYWWQTRGENSTLCSWWSPK